MSFWLTELVHNLAILLSLTLAAQLLLQALPGPKRVSGVLLGILFGGFAVLSMLTAFVYQPGVVFDARSIVLFLAGLFGGGVAGAVAMVMAGIYRALLGGPGIWAGLATIVVAGSFGIACRRGLGARGWPPGPWQLWALGACLHLLVLGCMLLLPVPQREVAMANLALPFLVVYPVATMLIGMVMAREENWSSSLRRLRHAEWLFSEAQRLTRFGSWEYRLGTDELTATPHLYEMLGLPESTEPLTLQDFFGRLHRDDWEPFREAFDAAIRGEGEIDVQGRLLADGGRTLWIRVVGKAVVAKGKTTGLVGNLVDITRRMTSELELRASEGRLQAIIDHAPALICLCDLDGSVLLANRRLEVFGTRSSTVAGQPLYALLPRDGALEQWLDDMVALRAGERVEFEETLRHADGTEHIYLVNKFVVAGEGSRPPAICYIANDISELRRSLTERRQLAEELIGKNEELERFTYSVSHDLKGPLVTIGSYTELLYEDIEAAATDRMVEDLGHIRAAVGKMRQLIDDLLELSRVGKTLGELLPVDLGEVTAEAWLLLSGDSHRVGAQIVMAPDLPIVWGDPLRLLQVMQNLLQNALKFGEPARPLHIAVNWTAERDGGYLVSVSDNGRGIAPDSLPGIFDLFTHGNGREVGAGIGLALVRRIMALHGGDVWAASAGAGAGSTFFLRFPAAPISSTRLTDAGDRAEYVL